VADRREALDERLSRLAADERLWPTVARLRAFRGVDTLTALALHLELGGDWQRFASPRKLSSWLGLVPSLDQSGERLTQGSITKTGSSIARRLLVEAAWHYARAPRIASPGTTAKPTSPTTSCRSPGAPSTACTAPTSASRRAANPPTSPRSPSPANWPASSGPPRPRHDLTART
jgi:hypothetical protein